jgi:hypothetical protein
MPVTLVTRQKSTDQGKISLVFPESLDFSRNRSSLNQLSATICQVEICKEPVVEGRQDIQVAPNNPGTRAGNGWVNIEPAATLQTF